MSTTSKTYLLIVFFIFFTFFSSLSFAKQTTDKNSQTPAQLDPIVITANLYKQFKKNVGQSVTVITQKEISQKQSLSTSDLLRDVAGLDIVSLGSPSEDLDIRIRGSDRDEVLVLLDGIPLNNLIESRAIFLKAIPVDLIEKIEIIRGASSVIYGTAATGGVVNIITKKGKDKPLHSILLQAGNLATFKETISSIGKIKNHYYSASFSRHDQGGRFANDRFSGNNFFANYGVHITPKLNLGLQLTYLDQNQELAFGTATSFANFPTVDIYIPRDLDRRLNRDVILPQTFLEWEVTDWYKLRFSYSMYYEDLSLKNSNQNETSSNSLAELDSQLFDSTSHRHTFDLRHTFQTRKNPHFKITNVSGFQTNLEFLNFSDAPFPGDTSTKTASTFPDSTLGQSGDRYNLAGYSVTSITWSDALNLSLGMRYDYNSTFGSAFSPRIGASYFSKKTNTKFFSNYSQGFLAPTINQYYLAIIGGTLSQRTDKEVSRTFDAGFEQKFGNFIEFGSTFFYTSYSNHIDELQLINRGYVQGLENFVSIKPFKWIQFNANYTFTDTKNIDDGSSFSNRPKHHINSEINVYPLKGLEFSLNGHFVSKRKIPNILSTETLGDLSLQFYDQNGIAAGEFLPNHFILNATVKYHHNLKSTWFKKLTYSLRANNILDHNYQEKFGYPMPGFNFLAGIQADFGS